MQDLARKNADGTAGLLLAAPDALQELWTAWSSITWTATGGIHKKKKETEQQQKGQLIKCSGDLVP